jgi:uncharacterized membrane protein
MEMLKSRVSLPHLLLGVILLATVLTIVRFVLNGSLWLDEFGPWAIRGNSLVEAYSKAVQYGQHPALYFLIIHLVARFGGESEWMLRLPSLIAFGLMTTFFYRQASFHFGGRLAAWMTSYLITAPFVIQAACNVRPYALGLFAAVISWSIFTRWYSAPGAMPLKNCCALLIWIAFTIQFHILWITLPTAMIFGQVITKSVQKRLSLSIVIGTVLGVAANYVLIQRLVSEDQKYSFLAVPQLSYALLAWVQVPDLLGMLMVVPLMVICRPRDQKVNCDGNGDKIQSDKLIFLIATLAILPVLTCLVAAITTGASLFADRHYGIFIIGFSLFLPLAIVRWMPSQVTSSAISLILIFRLIINIGANWNQGEQSEDWRGAVSYLNSLDDTARLGVGICPGYVEGNDIQTFNQSNLSDNYLSPVHYYHLRLNYRALPLEISEEWQRRVYKEFLEDLIRDRVKSLYVVNRSNCIANADIFALVLAGAPILIETKSFGSIQVIKITKNSA